MHGLQACLIKLSTFMISVVKMPLTGEVGGPALNSHRNYIVDHGKNHGIVFLNFCGNPVLIHFNASFQGKIKWICTKICKNNNGPVLIGLCECQADLYHCC